MTQEVLDKAIAAFWAEIAKNHPERETGDLDPGTAYDLERWAQHAYEVWLETNKPVHYVQRTMVQMVKITGAGTPEEAEAAARALLDPEWYDKSLDTSAEYIVLDASGTMVTG